MKSGMLIASVFLLAYAGTMRLAVADPLIGPGSRAMASSSTSLKFMPAEMRPVLLESLAKDAGRAPFGSIDYAEQKVLPGDDVARKAFGYALAFSADGNTALVGAPNSSTNPGTVYVFSNTGGVWTETQESGPSLRRQA